MAGRPRSVKPEPTTVRGLCITCKKNKQIRFKQNGKIRYRAYCQGCSNRKYGIVLARSIKKQDQTLYNYKKRLLKYGITPEQHQQMLEDQSLCCAICLRTETEEGRKFSIDHDHLTGKVRGLLCFQCNTGIGKLQDDPEILRRAIAYLE